MWAKFTSNGEKKNAENGALHHVELAMSSETGALT